MITFDGVIEMSNALGGVDVCVTQRIRDTDTGLDLSAGTHSLQGKDALEFLRTRHGVGDGSDLARISSQQVFLSSMMRKIISGGTLGSPDDALQAGLCRAQQHDALDLAELPRHPRLARPCR